MNEILKELRLNWANLKKTNPKIRIRDAAKSLGVSEAALLSTEIDNNVNYLNVDNVKKFIAKVLRVDKIMILTRNDSVVHEITVEPKSINFEESYLLDKQQLPILKFDYAIFKYVFYQKKIHAGKELRSFQIFSKNGNSCIKFFLKGIKNKEFDKLAELYKSKNNFSLQEKLSCSKVDSIISNSSYFDNLNKSQINNLILNQKALSTILIKCAELKYPIEIEVYGIGVHQYFRGRIKKVVNFGPWKNILDKNFNLHVLSNELNKVVAREIIIKEKLYCIFDFFDKKLDVVMRISILESPDFFCSGIMNEIKEKCYDE